MATFRPESLHVSALSGDILFPHCVLVCVNLSVVRSVISDWPVCVCAHCSRCVCVCGVCVENKAVADNVSIVVGALRPSLSQGPQG